MKMKPPTLVLQRIDLILCAEGLAHIQTTDPSRANDAHQDLIDALHQAANGEIAITVDLRQDLERDGG